MLRYVKRIIIVFIIIILFCFSWRVKQDNHKILSDCGVACAWWYGNQNPSFVGYRIVDELNQCFINHQQTLKTIIMPESTFCFDIKEFEHFIPIWCDGLDDVTIIFGTHELCQGSMRNVVYGICNGQIIFRYFKEHLMPLIEYHPGILNFFGIKPWCVGVSDQCPAKIALNNDDVLVLNGKKYQIFICSELFFQAKEVKGYPIIFLWNDVWLRYGWIKKIALLFIKYFSFVHQVPVWHVSTTGLTNMKQ
jgi:apolipoprotein N-acyltransferase